ncbi:MAG: 50S ribosomal protein L9 [Spirochaetia bacterium]|nr:50S ribosomal protein L9 [Spirochaetia bacterium]
MKVILKKDVPALGFIGDIKEVKKGYARNYLLPQGFVIVADAKSKKEMVFLEQVRKQKLAKREKLAKEFSSKINNVEVRITVKIGEDGKMFGSVTNLHIQRELEKAGHIVDKRQIHVEEPIKTLGIYNITLKLHENVNPVIKVFVQDENGSIEPPKKVKKEEVIAEAPAAESAETADAKSENIAE